MDDLRYQELVDKRGRVGLSDAEASELGRMVAERMGKPYRGPRDIHPNGGAPNGETPAAGERAAERNS
jgi:hypothetical protein